MILTSHGQLGDTGRKTGFYWEEFATPYWKLRDAGHTVDIASVKGGNPPADPGSAQPDGRAKSVQRFMDDAKAMAALKASKPIEEAELGDYDAVFLPGGHGTMWDLAQTSSVGEKIARAFEAGAVVAAVCHGPAGLTNAILSNGEPLVKGRKVNSFTDAEEEAAGEG